MSDIDVATDRTKPQPEASDKKATRSDAFPKGTLGWLILGMAADLADPILSYATFDDLVHKTTTLFTIPLVGIPVNMPGLIVLSLYGTSIALPAMIGASQAKLEDGDRSGAVRLVRIGALIAWAALGCVMLGLRLADTMSAEMNFGGNLLIAVLMLFMYCCGGLAIFHAAHGYFASAWHYVHGALSRARQDAKKAVKQATQAIHLVKALRKNTVQASLYLAERNDRLIELNEGQKRLKDQIRFALAAHLANPASSSLIFEPYRTTDDATNAGSGLDSTDTDKEH